MPKAWWSIKRESPGFTLAEILVSVAVFGLVVASVSAALVSLARHQKGAGLKERAVFLAEEGLEAVRNIRDAGYANLSDGVFGLSATSTPGQWSLVPSGDAVSQFSRQITISTVSPSQKSVTAMVTWPQGALSRSVSLSGIFTDWQAASAAEGGLLIYGDGTAAPQYRVYDAAANTFGGEAATASSTVGRTFVLRAAPNKNEALAGFANASGVLTVYCFNGSSWSEEWTGTVGGTGSTRRFDIAYETASGDAMVLYGANAAATNELAFRTKPGSTGCGSGNWSGAISLNPLRTSGVVHWVRLAWDRRSGQNLLAAIWADANSDLSAMIWNGLAWANEPAAATETSLEVAAASQDIESFDVEYESLSGDVMVVWGNSAGTNGTNGVRYRTCTGGVAACTWNAAAAPPIFSDDATTLDIAANPASDEIAFGSIGLSARDLQVGYWSGSAWTNTANADTSCNIPAAGQKLVAVGWVSTGGTSRSIIRYADQGSSAVDWYAGNAGSFTKMTDFAVSPSTNSPDYFDIQMNPVSPDQLMQLASGSGSQLFAKRLVVSAGPTYTWTNADGALLESALPQSINSPYGFAFWRQ